MRLHSIECMYDERLSVCCKYGDSSAVYPKSLRTNFRGIIHFILPPLTQTQSPSFPLNPQDHGSPQLSSTSYVAITVVDRDDRNPKFTRSVYRASVKEDYPIKVGTTRQSNHGRTREVEECSRVAVLDSSTFESAKFVL